MTKSIKRMKRLFAWGTALLLVGGMQAALLPVDEPILLLITSAPWLARNPSMPFLRATLILLWQCLGV